MESYIRNKLLFYFFTRLMRSLICSFGSSFFLVEFLRLFKIFTNLQKLIISLTETIRVKPMKIGVFEWFVNKEKVFEEYSLKKFYFYFELISKVNKTLFKNLPNQLK
jgi:hypothetical protein